MRRDGFGRPASAADIAPAFHNYLVKHEARPASGRHLASVDELAGPFAMSPPAISKHLKVLEGAGPIERGRDANAWLGTYWGYRETSFGQSDALLAQTQRERAGNDAAAMRPAMRPKRKRKTP